jgi:site-specific DNA recombinase
VENVTSAAANGRGGRYRYYVCQSARKYGRAECDGETLRADELETAMMEQLVALLDNEPLVQEEIERAFAEFEADGPRRAADLAALEGDLATARAALDRYFRAFENDSLPLDACGPRIRELHERIASLEARRKELSVEADAGLLRLTLDDVFALAGEARRVLAEGDDRQKKALLQGFVRSPRPQPRRDLSVLHHPGGSTNGWFSGSYGTRTRDLRREGRYRR